MSDANAAPEPGDRSPDLESFREDVLQGLAQPQKALPCKYLYDDRGSQLFEQICELEEYYPTRTELGIMEAHGAEMARRLGRACMLIEYGCGSSLKTRRLLERMRDPVACVLIDISQEALAPSARKLARAFPDLEVLPIRADYTRPVDLPRPRREPARRVVYYPGSTIGNFRPAAAQQFLSRMRQVAGPGGGVLIGVDLKKDVGVLERAYDDRQGVTAAFNLNLLARINAELDADFPLAAFRHRAFFNQSASRIEMHLEARRDLEVRIDGAAIRFRAGETIHTEDSYKYDLDQFAALAEQAGLTVRQVWTDPNQLFSVQFLAA